MRSYMVNAKCADTVVPMALNTRKLCRCQRQAARTLMLCAVSSEKKSKSEAVTSPFFIPNPCYIQLIDYVYEMAVKAKPRGKNNKSEDVEMLNFVIHDP